MANDVFKILKDLELKSVGLDERSKKLQDGYFIAFRHVGLPIDRDDFANPFSPPGLNLARELPVPGDVGDVDPPTARRTASAQISEGRIFAADIAQSQQSYLNAFLLTDDKLRMTTEYSVMPESSKVSDTWHAILSRANGMPVGSGLSPALQQASETARATLVDREGNPTPHYEAYLRFEDEYKARLKAWTRAYAAAFTDPLKLQNWPIEGRAFHEDTDEAMDRWVDLGFKQEIEAALGVLAAQGIDPAVMRIARARKRFINSLIEFQNVGRIPHTRFLPDTWYDRDQDGGWTDYTSRDFHHESHYTPTSSSYRGGGGFSPGFWAVSDGFENGQGRRDLKMPTQNLEIAFKYATVDIERPWLDSSLLNLTNWCLTGDGRKQCISTGRMGQELTAAALEPTFLPSVVTSLVLIKDLSITWDRWRSDWQVASSATSDGTSIGWGPFAVSGHYRHHNARRRFVADADGDALTSPGIQLVGYVSAINPASPAVDSSPFLQRVGARGGH